jgi:hypothetical protein
VRVRCQSTHSAFKTSFSQHNFPKSTVTWRGVTIDGIYTDEPIYCTIWYTVTTLYSSLLHTLVSIVASSVLLFGGGFQQRMFFCLWVSELSSASATRTGLLLGLASESRRPHDHILLSRNWGSPSWRARSPGFISPRNRGAQLYHQALGITHQLHALTPGPSVHWLQLSSNYIATDGQSVSRSVGQFVLVSGPPWRRWPDFTFLCLKITFFLLHAGRPLWREDGSVIFSAITHRLQSRRTHNHILLSHLRLPQPGGLGPRIYIPQEQSVPVIPQGIWFTCTSKFKLYMHTNIHIPVPVILLLLLVHWESIIILKL